MKTIALQASNKEFNFYYIKMFKSIFFVLAFTITVNAFGQHPICFATKQEVLEVKNGIKLYPLLANSYKEIKASVDEVVGKDIDVPYPKDAAGGYTHDKHKTNYTLIYNSGMLYQLTGEEKYAKLVKDVLLKYAILNPTLKKHPQATSAYYGHLFWQSLNDANWLVYSGLAYDCIHDYLTPAERKTIEDGAFKPEVDFFTKELKDWFNLIHNHAVWACAGVGIVGIATDNQDYVDMALKGADKDGKAGFLAQMEGLFSPDGYYAEGPYYTRYAILPFYVFANALNNKNSGLKIFNYRKNILQKALVGALQQTNLNGGFYSYNDALKEKSYISNEIVEALDIAWKVYGKDSGLLTIAEKQNRVTLNAGGMGVAAALNSAKNIAKYYPYKSVEFADGTNGDRGGVSILRTGSGDNLTTLIYKYTSLGMAHGHFDKLNYSLFDEGSEIIQDYGAVRFINIEQKWGGRYLPESKALAHQTISHNTLVVDEKSNYNGIEAEGEKYHPIKLYSSIDNKNAQVVSVLDTTAYAGVNMLRTIYMLQLPNESKPLIVDVFKIASTTSHQYDLPFNYLGTLISSSCKYQYFKDKQTAFGKRNGYQFYWKEAEGIANAPLTQFTFLNGNNTFYSISSLTEDSTKVYFTRLGANDTNFNIRRDPAYVLRNYGTNKTFVNVIEPHGKFNPVSEISTDSYSDVKSIKLEESNNEYTVVNITVHNKQLMIIQCNNNYSKTEEHTYKYNDKTINFKGPYTVLLNNANFK